MAGSDSEVKGALLCRKHAKQVQITGLYDGPCDVDRWTNGAGELIICDVVSNVRRANDYAEYVAASIAARKAE